jgi:hypothetical protein
MMITDFRIVVLQASFAASSVLSRTVLGVRSKARIVTIDDVGVDELFAVLMASQ